VIIWQQSCGGLHLSGVGNQALLALPITAFFASRQCPGVAIRGAMDWALTLARNKANSRTSVISGFHSSLEQSILTILLTAKSPVIAILARPIKGARLPSHWLEPIEDGVLAVVSANEKMARLTGDLAMARNRNAVQLAHNIVVAHASANGALAKLVCDWQAEGLKVTILSQ